MGTGGSRDGAGRPRQHAKAEQCNSLDVRRWQRDGILQTGKSGSWRWINSYSGERSGSIDYRVDGPSDASIVTLTFRAGDRHIGQCISIERTPCNFGGTRPWFICSICSRRAAKIYLRAAHFACRTCHQLVYVSQSLDAIGRGWRRQQKLEARLGRDCDRPKGMHQSTQESLIDRIRGCEARRIETALKRLPGFLQNMRG